MTDDTYGWAQRPPLDKMPPAVAALWKLGPDGVDRFIMTSNWYAEPNDLIGGWCIVPLPFPPSTGNIEIATFMDEKAARHIVALHNHSLHDQRKGGEA